jgi:Holliday junction resolvase RusA-like endonuclease
MQVKLYLPRPKNATKRWKMNSEILCGVKPDLDNGVKAICDALVKAGWLHDDALVQRISIAKVYHAEQESPRYEIAIQVLPGWRK